MLLVAAACHLGLVVAGGVDLCLWERGPLGRLLTYYAALSGADAGYAFFAPAVASPLRATIVVADPAGRTTTGTLTPRTTREAVIRTEDLVEVFKRIDRRTDGIRMRRDIARSWAAALFARYPDAASVSVDVGHDHVPTMAAIRGGATPRWRSLYRARIARARGPS